MAHTLDYAPQDESDQGKMHTMEEADTYSIDSI